MDEKVKVVEEPIVIQTVAKSMDTEVKEEIQEVSVQTVSTADIEVDDENIIDIEMSEAFPFMTNGALSESMDDKDVLLDGGLATEKNTEFVALQELLEISAESGTVNHSLLHGRDLSDQHPISAITGLRKELNAIKEVKRVYSSENGLAEFRKWADDNPKGDDRSGYFVSIVPGTDNIEICDSTHDVYGISVSRSGFVGNQSDFDKSDDYTYSIVGIVGAMRVRTDGTARNGEYVVPNDYGEATLSENNYGYKVLSQGSYPSYNYVTIAITPQSDALSRLQGSISGSGDLGNIIIQINGVKDKVDGLEIEVKEDIEEILGEVGQLGTQVTDAKDVATNAATNAEEAKDVAAQAAASAAQAQQDAQDAAAGAISSANQALSEVSGLADQMEPIVQWVGKDDTYSGAGGFVQQANEDHVLLSSIVSGSGPNGTSLAAIMQKVDENGAIIQHLVSHVDRYVIGEKSLSYGLTHDDSKSILTEEYIYVPTSTHEETMENDPEDVVTNFERNYYYIWNTTDYVWVKSKEMVSTATAYNDGVNNGDLWYCWQDVVVEDEEGNMVEEYIAGTLYRWFGNEWVAVASTADNRNARILTSIRQEADSIHSDVVNLHGDVSSIEQNVGQIKTRVGTAEYNISSINQEVDKINSTVATINGAVTSVQQQADKTDASLTAITYGRFHVVYHSYLGTAPDVVEDGKKYKNKPVWNDDNGIFEFAASAEDENGKYYFTSDDQTKYCEVVDADGDDKKYNIWTIGNKATASLDNRISTTEAILSGTAMLDTEDSSALSNITIAAKEDESTVSSIASYYYHSLISVSETEIPVLKDQLKYNSPPVWNLGKGEYVFDTENRDDNGTYYIADEKAQTYCKVVTVKDEGNTEDGNTEPKTKLLYEKYGLGDQSAAYMLQKADANSAAIGMVVDNNEVKGSVILEAVNNESNAKINADRIELTGSDQISMTVKKYADEAFKKRVTLTASSQMFIKDANADTYTPESITLTAQTSGTITSYVWYKDDSNTPIPNETSKTLTVTPEDIVANSATYKVVCTDVNGNEYTDVMSIAKLSDGKSGTTYYTWVKYADDASGTNMSDDPNGKSYIGLAYNQTSKNESNKYSDYQWSLIKGADGIGVDGKNYYTWVKYADDASGTNMSDDPNGKSYIGLAYNKEESTESNISSDYTWALFKGSDGIAGEDGYTVVLSNEFIEVPVTEDMIIKEDGKFQCEVYVYKGSTAFEPTMGNISESQFKVEIDALPSNCFLTVDQKEENAGTLIICSYIGIDLKDIVYIPLKITIYPNIILKKNIVVTPNTSEAAVESIADIKATVEDNAASIEMVVETKSDNNKSVRGGIIISAINADTSNVLINADKITLNGETIISKINGKDTDTTTIDGSKITTETITAEHLDFSVDDKVSAGISSAIEGMELSVSNEKTSSTITLTSGDVSITSTEIKFTGDIIFKDDLTDGATKISGSNVQTGIIKSENYNGDINTPPTAGTQINLNNGTITSANFSIDSLGNMSANSAELTSCCISDKLFLYNSNNNTSTLSYLSDGGPERKGYLISIGGDGFTIDCNGYVTINKGLRLYSSLNGHKIEFKTLNPDNEHAGLDNDYKSLSYIDSYYDETEQKYYTRWATAKDSGHTNVIKIHSVDGNISMDAGPLKCVYIGTAGKELSNGGVTFGQTVEINSQNSQSQTNVYGLNIDIGATGTKTIDIASADINLNGSVYVNGNLLTNTYVAIFG